MAQVSKDSTLDVSSEFIKSGKSLKTKQKKRGGPYTKDEKIKRQNEVYRLHFEYGYSARKISELMKINRNTISNDISSLYSKLNEEMDRDSFDDWLNKQFARLESQRAMLRKELDKEITLQEKLQISKMIQNLDWKITTLLMKIKSMNDNALEKGVNFVNYWLEKNGHTERYMSKDSLYKISDKSREKVLKILDEE